MPATVIVAPCTAAPSSLTGVRNDSSILFSLGTLAETTTKRIRPERRVTGASRTVRPEGSGLLDIRTMAETYRADHTPVDAHAPADPFAAQAPESFALSPSLLLPAQPPVRTDRKLLVTLAGLTGVLAIAAIVLAVLVVKGNGDSHAATNPVEPNPTEIGPVGEPGPAPVTREPTTREPPTKDSVTSEPAIREPVAERPIAKRPVTKRPVTKRPIRKRPIKRPVAKKPPKKCMDAAACLIMDNPPACCLREHGLKRPKPPAVTKPDPNLPKSLTGGAISAGIRRVSTSRCRDLGVGTVVVRLKVKGNGSVASVAVKSAPNTAIGKCVASRVKGASFRKTQSGGSFNYAFPFR